MCWSSCSHGFRRAASFAARTPARPRKPPSIAIWQPRRGDEQDVGGGRDVLEAGRVGEVPGVDVPLDRGHPGVEPRRDRAARIAERHVPVLVPGASRTARPTPRTRRCDRGPTPAGARPAPPRSASSSSRSGTPARSDPSRPRSSQSWYQPITVTRWPARSVPDQSSARRGPPTARRRSPAVTAHDTVDAGAELRQHGVAIGARRQSSPPVEGFGADDVLGAEAVELRIGDAELPSTSSVSCPSVGAGPRHATVGPGRQPHRPRSGSPARRRRDASIGWKNPRAASCGSSSTA